MRDPAFDTGTSSPSSSSEFPARAEPIQPSPDFSLPRLEPVEFARWVEERRERLAERWLAGVRTREVAWDEDQEALMRRFFSVMCSMLPATLGPYREQVEPLWVQAAELFGSAAAQRGLAAGEVIEEFQVVRDILIRFLYTEPPVTGGVRMSLRDILRLNRVIDRGVTQASVGHTDVLFFALFKGSGVPESLDDTILEEVREQLDGIAEAFHRTMRSLRH